jgi:hypothetical protein
MESSLTAASSDSSSYNSQASKRIRLESSPNHSGSMTKHSVFQPLQLPMLNNSQNAPTKNHTHLSPNSSTSRHLSTMVASSCSSTSSLSSASSTGSSCSANLGIGSIDKSSRPDRIGSQTVVPDSSLMANENVNGSNNVSPLDALLQLANNTFIGDYYTF